MDYFNLVAKGLEKLRETVEFLKPVAKEFGGPTADKVTDIVSAGVEIATHAVERIEQGAEVAASRDEAVIRQHLTELQAENDELKAYIAAS